MRKILVKILAITSTLFLTFGIATACGGDKHECFFDKQVVSAEYELLAPTCETEGQYYYSCSCGKKGDTTFEVQALEHDYQYETNKDYTHVKTCANDSSHTATEDCTVTDGVCSDCLHKYYSVGLSYELVESIDSYIVSKGTCADVDVIIPSTHQGKKVYRIDDFSDCKNMQSIVIPQSVTAIDSYAFEGCVNLVEINIPSSVTVINDKAFNKCNSLTVYCQAKSKPKNWSSSWKSDRPVVWDCLNKEVADDGYIYKVENGVRYALKNGQATLANQPDNLQEVNVPSSVTYNGNDYNVTAIEKKAFEYCYDLTSITINDSVTQIGDSAFTDCFRLTIYCKNTSKPSGWSSSWSSDRPVVWDCENNKLDGNGYSYAVIGDYKYTIKGDNATVMSKSTKIVEANIPSSITYNGKTYSVTSIGDRAFSYCDNLTSVQIQPVIASVGANIFIDCQSLDKINFTGTVDEWAQITFKSSILDSAKLYVNNQLVTDALLSTATKVSSYAFANYDSLTSVKIVSNVKSIEEYAFYHCKNLKTVEILSGVESIGGYAFAGCALTKVTLNSGLQSIGGWAFSGCDSLTSIKIPSTVNSMGQMAFSDEDNGGTGPLTFYCEAKSKPSGWHENWKRNNAPVVWDCANNDVASDGKIYTFVDGIKYGIKGGVATVERQGRGFNIEQVTIPSSITYKGKSYSVTSIKELAFYYCANIKSVQIAGSVQTIGSGAFQHCENLQSVVILDGVKTIGQSAFNECVNLESVVMPASTTVVEKYAFAYCSKATIYCKANSMPSGWEKYWDYSTGGIDVVWGYIG